MIRIEQANALHLPLEDESVDCIVTSPPYLGLRDYGIEPTDWPEIAWTPMAGLQMVLTPAMSVCLGLEDETLAYVGHMVAIARELGRVLKKTGTLWLNLGDSYAGSWGAQGREGSMADRSVVSARQIEAHPKKQSRTGSRDPSTGLPRKNLKGVPWRVALALQADGWYLRNEIIWRKRSPLPESCRDRATVSHEHVFLLTRRPRYYFNQEAWLEPCSPNTHARVSQDVMAQAGSVTPDKRNGPMKAVLRGGSQKFPSAWDPNNGAHSAIAYNTAATHQKTRKMAEPGNGIRNNTSFEVVTGSPLMGRPATSHQPPATTLLRNRRTVWDISSQPTSDPHFATFPEALVEPCLLAGAPPHGTVLDPFCGTGTTLAVANRMDLHAIGFDLDPKSIALAKKRVTPDVLPGSIFFSPERSDGVVRTAKQSADDADERR